RPRSGPTSSQPSRECCYPAVDDRPLKSERRDNHPAAVTEADSRETRPLAVTAHDDLVAVGEEGAGLPIGQTDRIATAPGAFDEGSAALWIGAGDGPAAEQVTRPEIAAVARVVSHQLSDGPIHRGKPAAADADWLLPPLPHASRGEIDLDPDIEPTAALICVPEKIW